MGLIAVGVVSLIAGFAGGLFFERQNSAEVEQWLADADKAHDRVYTELLAARQQIARLTKKKIPIN